MSGYGGFLLYLCWGLTVFSQVYGQTSKPFAPQNVTIQSDSDSLYITWAAPEGNQASSQELKAFRVQVFTLLPESEPQPQPQSQPTPQPQPQPQPSRDHWVPKGNEQHLYSHRVTCLEPSRRFQVKVLAVYPTSANISESQALSDPVKRDTKSRSFLRELFDHPIQIVVGAGLTILILLAIVPAAIYCLCRRRSRRRLLRVSTTGVETTQHRQKARKSISTSTLPSAKDLQYLETRDNHQSPSLEGTGTFSLPCPTRQSPANQRSPLMHYSPPSSYQSWSSVPSQIAPARPSQATGTGKEEDVYELDGDLYENVLQVTDLSSPCIPVVKSTSFSGVSRPCKITATARGGKGGGVPPAINEGRDGGDDRDDDDDDDDDEDCYINMFGRRCATMPSSSKKPQSQSSKQAIECIDEDLDIYGNC